MTESLLRSWAVGRAALSMVLLTAAAACDDKIEGPMPAPVPVFDSSEPPAALDVPVVSASAPAPPPVAIGKSFVRNPPHSANPDADAVDECNQSGGMYFSCHMVWNETPDGPLRRYLWRIAQGYAAGVDHYESGGAPIDPGGLPHAEVPYMCDLTKPCGFVDEHGEHNTATQCLAKVVVYDGSDAAMARRAHALACKCDAANGDFPSYNRTPYICDVKGKPTFIAPKMKREEGRDIVDCAICHPTRGAAACDREIARLASVDAALSSHIRDQQVVRCRTPSKAPPIYPWSMVGD